MDARPGQGLVARIAAVLAQPGVLEERERVLVLVSGGPDSMALMHVLAQLIPDRLDVLTMDHGVRPEAAQECADVVDHATRAGIPVHVESLELPAGSGMHARARDARYAAARRHAARRGGVVIATGHTADDQAETVLMRLARGTGLGGAAAMAVRHHDLLRPLLDVGRAETRAWCVRHGIGFHDDPSNRDPRYARVRARALLAQLEDVSPGARDHLCGFAARARDDDALLQDLARQLLEQCTGEAGWDAPRLAAAHPALARRAVRIALADAGVEEDGRAAAVIADICAHLTTGMRRDLPGGATVVVGDGVMRVERGPIAPLGAPGEVTPLSVPGAVPVPGGLIRARLGIASAPTPRRVSITGHGPFSVRGAAHGDRIAIAGDAHASAGRILAGARVPSRVRGRVPVVLRGDQVVWIAGHRACLDALAPEGAPATVLTLEDE